MILVTGGTGLLGSYLLRELVQQGKRVRAIYRAAPSPFLSAAEHAAIEWIACDILDVVGLAEAMQGVAEVHHCAAVVSFNPKKRKKLLQINVEGTANVVNAALDAGVRKLVHVSSVAALGRIREGQTVNETMNWTKETSNSVYGESKYKGELEVWRGIGEGLNAVIVNPSIILGAGDWTRGSSELFKSAYDEFPWYSEGVTGFVDARDVVKAMIDLMQSDVQAERMILSGENCTYKEVLTWMAESFGKKPPQKKIRPFLASLVWRFEALKSRFTGKDPLVTKETAQTALTKVYFDNSKVKQLLPDFSFTPIRETVATHCKALIQKLG
jgi:nucleoside-diphosphate-sugar epimerase